MLPDVRTRTGGIVSGPCTDCGGPDYQTLEARIADLEAENEEWIGYFDACYTDMCHYKDRAEQAEAALADWRAMYSMHVRPKCGSDMAYKAQVAFDMGCVETGRAIAADSAEEGSEG